MGTVGVYGWNDRDKVSVRPGTPRNGRTAINENKNGKFPEQSLNQNKEGVTPLFADPVFTIPEEGAESTINNNLRKQVLLRNTEHDGKPDSFADGGILPLNYRNHIDKYRQRGKARL